MSKLEKFAWFWYGVAWIDLCVAVLANNEAAVPGSILCFMIFGFMLWEGRKT